MGNARLCVTVTAATMAELRRARDNVRDAHLVELRLDSVKDPDAAGALAERRTPVIVTCRPAREGGAFRGSEEERRRLLADAQRLGAEYIDVEWTAGFDELIGHRAGRGVIVSHHDFGGMPADPARVVSAMRATGAEVVKLAAMARRLTDAALLAGLTGDRSRSTVLIAMGDAGVATRALPDRFGSCWSYAGEGVAPGQITASQLRDELHFDRVTRDTSLYGVVGRPVMHSLSPAMHNAAFAAAGIDAVYLPLAAADIDDFRAFADALHVRGASVTAPFKLDACAIASARDDVSALLGAANTLRRDGGAWSAFNTDVHGFLAPLGGVIDLAGCRATVLGAGGAARAAACALRREGAAVAIAARRADRAAETSALIGAATAEWPPAAGSWDLLVNATPVGMPPREDDSPVPARLLTGRVVYDLVYYPSTTRLLRESGEAGCRTIGGLEMLVAQAERQFALWSGAPPRGGVMRAAALAALERRAARPAHGESPDVLPASPRHMV